MDKEAVWLMESPTYSPHGCPNEIICLLCSLTYLLTLPAGTLSEDIWCYIIYCSLVESILSYIKLVVTLYAFKYNCILEQHLWLNDTCASLPGRRRLECSRVPVASERYWVTWCSGSSCPHTVPYLWWWLWCWWLAVDSLLCGCQTPPG